MFRKAIVWNWEFKKSQVREILMRLAKNNPKPNQNLAGAASLHLIYFVQFVTRRQGNWQMRKIQPPEVRQVVFEVFFSMDLNMNKRCNSGLTVSLG